MSTNRPRALVAGNWKMNGLAGSLVEAEKLAAGIASGQTAACDVMLCPPATLLAPMRARLGSSPVLLGGQDCHANASGAHTGDIAAEMLKDAGARAVRVLPRGALLHQVLQLALTLEEEADNIAAVSALVACGCAVAMKRSSSALERAIRPNVVVR